MGWLLWIPGLFLVACQRDRKVTPEVFLPMAADSIPALAQQPVYRGLFVVGKNTLSFKNCEQEEPLYAVADSSGQLAERYREAFLHTPAFPYEYVYVEVEAVSRAADEWLFARGYDSVLQVSRVLTLEQKNYRNACIPYDFWALGNEWSLQISGEEGMLVLKDFRSMNVFVFEYFAPKTGSSGALIYSSNNYAVQASIKATIAPEICPGDTTGEPYPYSATVLLNGKRYEGCAVRGTALQ